MNNLRFSQRIVPSILLIFFALLSLPAQDNIIHYTETTGFDHQTRDVSLTLFQQFGNAHGFTVLPDNDGSLFNKTDLAQARAVIFSNTSGDQGLNPDQRAALEWFVDTLGGHLLGIHAATDTYRHSSSNGSNQGTWDWYAETLGGSVQNNPNHTSQNHVDTIYLIQDHPSVANIAFPWIKQEEYYYWHNGYLNADIEVILEVGATGGGIQDQQRPVAWFRTGPGDARIFYTSLGHKQGNYTGDFPAFEQLLEDAVLWLLAACPPASADLTATICEGDSYPFDGQQLSDAGTYNATFQTTQGCDSTVTLNLDVIPTVSTSLNASICEGDSYPFDGQQLSDAGTYNATFQTTQGCDSTVTLNLDVIPTVSTSLNASICEGDSYPFDGQQLSDAGTYNATFQTTQGCDSTVTLNLDVIPTVSTSLNASICEGDSYPFDGQQLSDAGTYNATFQTTQGCDSTVTLNLDILTVDTAVTQAGPSLTATATAADYQWLDCDNDLAPVAGATEAAFTPMISGNYAIQVTTGEGCTGVSACYQVIITDTEEAAVGRFRLFPNPVKDRLNLDLNGIPGVASLGIYSLQGQLLSTENRTVAGLTSVDISSLQPGVYLLRIAIRETSETLKFVKK